MQLVEPWDNDDVSDEIFKINPTFMPREQLSPAQQSVSLLLLTHTVLQRFKILSGH